MGQKRGGKKSKGGEGELPPTTPLPFLSVKGRKGERKILVEPA